MVQTKWAVHGFASILLQDVLLRKGGLREPVFEPKDASFLLFPTAFHTEGDLIRPAARERYRQALAYDPRAQAQVELNTGALVTGAWTTLDPEVLEVLSELHIWEPRFLHTRLKWRPRQPITILELRAFRLASPQLLDASNPDLFGCFSWLTDTPGAVPGWLPGATPALEELAFAAAQLRCRQLLQALSVQEVGQGLVQSQR